MVSDLHHRGNDITGIIDETFTTTEERFGEIFTVELRPGEADIPVTEEKKNYVNAIVEYRLSKCANDQFEALMIGLCEPVPWDVLQTFDEQELELLISSISEIGVYATYPSSARFVLTMNIYQRRLEQIHRPQRI